MSACVCVYVCMCTCAQASASYKGNQTTPLWYYASHGSSDRVVLSNSRVFSFVSGTI